MRTLSLAALTVLELSPVEMVRCAADAGFSHVGLRLLPATPDEPAWDVVGDTPMLRELLAALADTGVQALDIEILRLEPDPWSPTASERSRPAPGSVRVTC